MRRSPTRLLVKAPSLKPAAFTTASWVFVAESKTRLSCKTPGDGQRLHESGEERAILRERGGTPWVWNHREKAILDKNVRIGSNVNIINKTTLKKLIALSWTSTFAAGSW